ncbi:hypothetical protein CLOM_g18443, partial [Closterium sp. NIES-68]
SGSYGIFQTGSAVRILADTDGGQLYPQNCFPNSVDRTSIWNAVRTHQRTGNVPSRNEPHSTTTLDECVVVYLDDILIYSRDMKQHVEHLRRVFEILRRERFYVKLSKSEFALEKVQFLGHMVSAQGVHVDPKKIEAVRTWKTPENVKELQQFLGFANYYNRFVPQYAKIAAPLTNLLKKNTPYKWDEAPGSRGAAETSTTSAPVLICQIPNATTSSKLTPHNSSFDTSSHSVHSNHTHLRPRPQVHQQVLEGTYVSPRDQTRHVIRLPSADRRTDQAPQPDCRATPPSSLQGRDIQMGLASASSIVCLQQCYTCRYWKDVVLPLLRPPPTHTTKPPASATSPPS